MVRVVAVYIGEMRSLGANIQIRRDDMLKEVMNVHKGENKGENK